MLSKRRMEASGEASGTGDGVARERAPAIAVDEREAWPSLLRAAALRAFPPRLRPKPFEKNRRMKSYAPGNIATATMGTFPKCPVHAEPAAEAVA